MSAEQVFQHVGRLRGSVQTLLSQEPQSSITLRSALQTAQDALMLALQAAKAAADEEATRQALIEYIRQHDATSLPCGLTAVQGMYVIGWNAKREAVCLIWPGEQGEVSPRALSLALQEADACGCARPARVYGYWCRVAEAQGRWTFCQLDPEWVHAALEGIVPAAR